jgi:hypothetical protein
MTVMLQSITKTWAHVSLYYPTAGSHGDEDIDCGLLGRDAGNEGDMLFKNVDSQLQVYGVTTQNITIDI